MEEVARAGKNSTTKAGDRGDCKATAADERDQEVTATDRGHTEGPRTNSDAGLAVIEAAVEKATADDAEGTVAIESLFNTLTILVC